MNRLPVLYMTPDDALDNRLQAYLGPVADLHPQIGPISNSRLRRFQPCIFIFDTRVPNYQEILAELATLDDHTCPVIALAVAGSAPWRAATAHNLYAIESVEIDGMRLRMIVKRAAEWLGAVAKPPVVNERLDAISARRSTVDHLPLRFLGRALGAIADEAALWSNFLEGLCESLRTSRAGIFMRHEDAFTLLNARHAVSGSGQLRFDESDEIVSWLEDRRQLLTVPILSLDESSVARAVDQAMRLMGAVAVVPLEAEGVFCGWLYIGPSRAGGPLSDDALDELSTWGELACGILNLAARQRIADRALRIAEKLPELTKCEILAVDRHAVVVMGVGNGRYTRTGSEIDRFDSTLGAAIRGAVDERVNRTVCCRLDSLEPRTAAIIPLRQSVEQIEALLVIGMGDLQADAPVPNAPSETILEMRNRLVAMNTFVQLLPERYDDPDFRTEFVKLVTVELDALKALVASRLAGHRK